ncbi:hypothetical protein ETB97_001843 [Aspergillus alliaceus]|uniref:Uncharacterized protein n=1 Tax=Petromyces alliaceus TaxID=209559 RepID=A0A5N6FQX7_PETAA|nr:uncharacterized protein BDW43DRAFT_108359 [Aspergillus alliaceus]KAB8232392.1 hypothetical protein BDW43DRAFT_108359 [Aspergillus alliaceus]KAF5860200.1 hypothetical protein ETB97_001843 [Aspergillus burnettii]
MEAWDLQLTVPRTHTLLEAGGDVHTPPITGSVAITGPSSALDSSPDNFPKVNISLVRSVTPRQLDPTVSIPKKSRGSFFKRHHKHSPTSHNYHRTTPTLHSDVETIVQCDLWHSPDEVDSQDEEDRAWMRLNFIVPIPSNIPATAETVLGDVSYAIRATVTSPTAPSMPILIESQPIKILRRVISEPVQYLRQYPGERVSTELYLTPDPQYPDLLGRTKAAYSLQWVARSTITKGERKTEVKYIVVKELKWRVEETVKHITISTDGDLQTNAIATTCKAQHVRHLCDGNQKGHWIASGASRSGDDLIEIPFDIVIPPEVNAANELTLSSYACQHRRKPCECDARERSAIVVDHQLKLEVITGVDTFDQETGKLVDRKPRVKSFNAAFPLSIGEFISGDDLSLSELLADDTLPSYDDAYLMPPNYATAQ